MLKKKFKFKKKSSQKIRRMWIDASLKLWGKLIVHRDKSCQWCHGAKCKNFRLGGHHIVSRGITRANKIVWFDEKNGMALGWWCHSNIKSQPDEYIEFRDKWLSEKGLNYKDMRRNYNVIAKLDLDDLKLIHSDLERKVKVL